MTTGTRMWSITSAVAVLAVTIGGSVAVAVPVSAAADSATTPVTSLDVRASKNAPKAGKKCKKRGKTVTTAAGTFKCKKKGKKLVWKKTANPVTPAPIPAAPAPVPVTPASPTPPAETGSSAVSDGGPTKVASGGVTVVASAGAIGTGQTLSITKAPEGAAVPDVAGDKLAAPVFDISSSQGQPSGPVTVTMAYDAAKLTEGGAPLVLHEDTELGLWAPEETTVNPDGTVSATFEHFSLFSVADTYIWATGWLTGNRTTDTPDCAGTPSWITSSGGLSTELNNPVLSCFTDSTDSTVDLRLVSNRGYPIVLDVNGANYSVVSGSTADTAMGAFNNGLANTASSAGSHLVFLPGGAGITLRLQRPSDQTRSVQINDIAYGGTGGQTLIHLGGFFYKQLNELMPSQIDCATKAMYDTYADRSFATASEMVKTCADTAVNAGKLTAAGKALLKKLAIVALGQDVITYSLDHQLGRNPTISYLATQTPTQPGGGSEAPPPPPGATHWQQISTAGQMTCGVNSAGAAHCWSYFGIGAVPAPDGGQWKQINSASGGNACAVTTGGAAYCWGNNFAGQLGDGTTQSSETLVPVVGLSRGVEQITTSGEHACALMTAGTVYCWGRNDQGQLGNGTNTADFDVPTPTPVQVVGLNARVKQISTSGQVTCAVTVSGAVYCWGYNGGIGHQVLGDGSTTSSSLPVPVTGLGSGVTQVSLHGTTTCAVTNDGSVYCWGSTALGQASDLVGKTTQSLTPVRVQNLAGATAVAVGWGNACAVTTGGAAYCWGQNWHGELGDGTTSFRPTPVPVSGLGSGVASISASDRGTSCAVTTSGSAYCWGYNGQGEFGNGTTTDSRVPVPVSDPA